MTHRIADIFYEADCLNSFGYPIERVGFDQVKPETGNMLVPSGSTQKPKSAPLKSDCLTSAPLGRSYVICTTPPKWEYVALQIACSNKRCWNAEFTLPYSLS